MLVFIQRDGAPRTQAVRVHPTGSGLGTGPRARAARWGTSAVLLWVYLRWVATLHRSRGASRRPRSRPPCFGTAGPLVTISTHVASGRRLDRAPPSMLCPLRPVDSHVKRAQNHSGSPLLSIPAPLCCQGRGPVAFEGAPALVAVKVVRPVGRSTLTAPTRRCGGLAAGAAWLF